MRIITAAMMAALAAGAVLPSAVSLAQTKKPAETESIRASRADCRRLIVEHRPAPDVAYKPGVDVRGKPVVGADLNPAPQIQVPDNIAFDIAIDLSKYGLPANSALFQPNFKLGEVRMDVASGRVLYNGQPLGNPEIEALREACRAQGLAKP